MVTLVWNTHFTRKNAINNLNWECFSLLSQWTLYFLELTSTHLHFFEGQGTSLSRKHLRSREIKGSDEVCERKSAQKNIFKFYVSNADGKYEFQVITFYGASSRKYSFNYMVK